VFGAGCDHVSVDGLAALAAGLHDNNSLRTVDLSCEWRCEIDLHHRLAPVESLCMFSGLALC
jgi:hypothetical protein